MSLFERLYSTEPGSLQDNFVAYWVKVASRFANNPFVVGYDPINEPFPSNIYTDPEYFYSPGSFDRKVLQPLYKRIFETAYLPASSSKIMFYEPAQVPDTVFPVGFTDSPAGSNYTQLQLMNDHSYGPCALLENSTEAVNEVCNLYHQIKVGMRANDAKKVNVPLIISEFGACMDSDTCIVEITGLLDASDAHLTSWAYWQYKKLGDLTTTAGTGSEGFYNEDGTLQDAKVASLARPYLPYSQGTLESVNYNMTTKVLNATFTLDTTIKAPTVVYFNQEYTYLSGITLTLFSSTGAVLVEGSDFTIDRASEDNYWKVQVTKETYHKQTVTLILSPDMTSHALLA